MIHPVLPFILLSIVIILLLLEIVLVKRSRERILIRILVNGTRGKSSVVEYIAAGLRAGGIPTFAKITGVIPTIFLPDGQNKALRRRGPARVQEQVNMLQKASKLQVNAVVMENMSLKPEYQRLESNVLKPTIYVITNILDDHREEMGATDEERVRLICSAIPLGSNVVTIDTQHRQIIEDEAKKRESALIVVTPEQDNIENLPSGVFSENLLLARTVCKLAGMEGEQVWNGMLNYARTNAETSQLMVPVQKGFRFINGFAVNDFLSAEKFLSYYRQGFPQEQKLILVLNTRADRPLRTVQFARWCATRTDLSKIILIGTHRSVAKRILLSGGCLSEKVEIWNKNAIRNCVQHWQGSGATVIGIGNIAGDGFLMLNTLNESVTKEKF
ncbi:MAG: poly-gamma-glutamate synthase PgsB [bacterium]